VSKKPSHIPLFPDAYLRDTTHLTTDEHGAYFLLLMAAWGTEDCSLPNDEGRLAALAKMPVSRWRKIASTVLEFWTIERGRIWQGRLRKEWLYCREKSEKAKSAVAQRKDRTGYGRTSNVGTNDLHLGGGGGVLAGNKTFDGSTTEGGDQNERTPFDVIRGGRS
jgi:uncharacterized protein YdaU (DUF1376 family)